MKKLTFFLILVFVIMLQPSLSEVLDPFEILNKIDSNMTFKTAYTEMEMIITIKKREIVKMFKSFSEGSSRSFIEFLSPVRDSGTKILKKDKVIKIYYPSAERILRLSGHMLRQSMMGSDMSYEDMTERSNKLREDYSAEMFDDEIVDGNKCYV